ncbi:MAG: RNA methyltransferase [Clostridia bacterium]|nr:RNA methyltransferase [Clostridia bacterium]
MIKENLKYSNSNIFEGMPSISAVIRSIECRLSDRRIITVSIDKGKLKSKAKEISFLQKKSELLGFDVVFTKSENIDALVVGSTHGGIIAECTPRTFPALNNDLIIQNGVYYLLDGIEDPYNFGNAIRSIYASGADGLIIGERNWLSAAGTVARSSAGTSELLPTYVCDTQEAINLFKSKGYKVACAGIRDSVSLFEADLSKPLLLILGGEKRGISRAVLDKCDEIIRIDYGTAFNGSLSASASAAVFAFEIMRYNKK